MEIKHRFVQLHLLMAYPPCNPNRDELGEPKNAVMGGARRSRMSSQSLKYAWRNSRLWNSEGMEIGIRTREFGKELYEILEKGGHKIERTKVKGKDVEYDHAKEWACEILKQFTDKPDLRLEQPLHFSTREINEMKRFATSLAADKKHGDTNVKQYKAELEGLLDPSPENIDIAMFGRMVAKRPEANVDGAVQVAHAISINEVEIEQDYFTAVDDLNRHGAAHVNEQEFVSAVYYLYLCVDTRMLAENIGDIDKARKAVKVLVESAATIPPVGKLHSYANFCRAFYILAEKGGTQPRNLSLAFLKPHPADQVENAIASLNNIKEGFNRTYTKPDDEKEMSIFNKQSCNLEDIKNFAGDF